MKKFLAVLALMVMVSNVAYAGGTKPKTTVQGETLSDISKRCDATATPVPAKPIADWTQADYEKYYSCYYKPCREYWTVAGWTLYPGACCAPGVDCTKL